MTDNDFDALWTNLVDRSHKAGSVPLSECEQHFYAVNLLRGSVLRSGFMGYFENHKAPDIAHAHEGLKALGLDAVLDLLEQAQKIALGDKPQPTDSSYLTLIPEELTEEEQEAESERMGEAIAPIEEEFYNYEDEMWDALCAYADEHELKPRG